MVPPRPRRSVLFMPASNARALEKARTLNADVIAMDLEDAVGADDKSLARQQAAAAVKQGGYSPRELVIRINGLDTDWMPEDLAEAVDARPDAILVPKISKPEDLIAIEAGMTAAEAPLGMDVWAMIETPLAVLNLKEIAMMARQTRLAGLVVGTNDLGKEMGAQMTPDREAFHMALSLAVMTARANGLVVIDGGFNDFKDPEGLERECVQGRAMGFDGKTLIHPSQLDICNAAFSPDADALNAARDIIRAFSDPANAGKAVLNVNGKMVEELHLAEARKLVAMDEAIQARAKAC